MVPKTSDSGYAYNASTMCMCSPCRTNSLKSVIAFDRFYMDYLAPIITLNVVGGTEKSEAREENKSEEKKENTKERRRKKENEEKRGS